jgi:hypothetical protein
MPIESYRANLRSIEDAQKTGTTELRLEFIEQKDLIRIVETLPQLTFLQFTRCKIQDYAPLKALSNLKKLHLIYNISCNDYSFLQELPQLTYLYLAVVAISPEYAIKNASFLNALPNYATGGLSHSVFVSKYMVNLPNEVELTAFMQAEQERTGFQ